MKSKKKRDLLIILGIYVLSYIVSFFVYRIHSDVIIALLSFDVICTIIVWLFGVVLKNSSVYDPYWSLTPLIMLLILVIDKSLFSLSNIIFLLVFSIWSNRLTINWMITFKDLTIQDWRYDMYKEKNPKLWPIINFFGINFMPTVLVFCGMIPGIILLKNEMFSLLSVIGYLIILFGTILEFIADHEMHTFLKEKNTNVCENGLWKYSRHPNYLGEILIWVGVFICLFGCDIKYFYLGFGFILIFMLFMFISIPMMERRQITRRKEYIDYIDSTSKLFLWKKAGKQYE